MSNTKTKGNAPGKIAVRFAAIDQYVESNMVSPKEVYSSSKGIMLWGDNNIYPEYLLGLYKDVPTLGSIINGNIDYIVGDEIRIGAVDFQDQKMNPEGETITEQCRNIAHDYEVFGGFALMVRRNVNGGVAAVDYIDLRFLRLNKTGDVFYYSEKWTENGKKDVRMYPAFIPDLDWASLDDAAREEHAASILYVKRGHTQVYPMPIYGPAVKACEIERCIDDFHLNSIENGFTASMIVNFNNGVPTDQQQDEIEEEVNEKFSGHQNAGRIMCSFNPDKESAATFEVPDVKDFGERYNALAKHSRQQIFTSFRAIPALFGLMSESTGFNTQEFEQSFKLYNRTQIRPVQRLIADAYDKIFGVQGILTITPFDISNVTETKVD